MRCPTDTVCCEVVLGLTSSGTTCQQACAGLGQYVACRTNADCPATAKTCVDSPTLPGFRHCQ